MQTFSLFYVKQTQGFVIRDRTRRKQTWAECFIAIMSLCGRGGRISQTSLTWRNLTTCKWGLKRIKASSGCMTHFCVYHLLHHGSRGHRFLRIGNDQVSPASCDHSYTGTFVVLCFTTANQEVHARSDLRIIARVTRHSFPMILLHLSEWWADCLSDGSAGRWTNYGGTL